MPVHYRLYQNMNQKSDYFQKWYGKAVHMGTMETDDIAEIIQRNCSMKKSDVKAVIEELVEVVRDQMQEGKRVKLNGFGSFKVGLSTTRADTAEKFDPQKNIKSLHIVFQPAVKVSKGKTVKTLLEGVKVAELPIYKVEKAKAASTNP